MRNLYRITSSGPWTSQTWVSFTSLLQKVVFGYGHSESFPLGWWQQITPFVVVVVVVFVFVLFFVLGFFWLCFVLFVCMLFFFFCFFFNFCFVFCLLFCFVFYFVFVLFFILFLFCFLFVLFCFVLFFDYSKAIISYHIKLYETSNNKHSYKTLHDIEDTKKRPKNLKRTCQFPKQESIT